MRKFFLFIVIAGCFLVDIGVAEQKASEGKSTIYSPVGKRDPFKPPLPDKVGRDNASVNPLERYSVDKYQLKAILKGMGKPRAMFEDPEGRTFILSAGQYLGRERGTLSRILNKEVIITERTFNYLGQQNLYERVLTLPPDEETGQIEAKGVGQGNVRKGADGPGGGGGGGAPGAPAGANPAPPAPPAAAAPVAPPPAAQVTGANTGLNNVK